MSELRETLQCMEIQIKKSEDALDIIDKKLTESMVAMAAIRFDFERLKTELNMRNLMDKLKDE